MEDDNIDGHTWAWVIKEDNLQVTLIISLEGLVGVRGVSLIKGFVYFKSKTYFAFCFSPLW